MRLFLLAATLLLQTSTPTPSASNTQLIVEQLNTFAQRMHDKQEDAILASYSKDAVFIDPSGKRFAGLTAMRKLYNQVFAAYDSDLHFDKPIIVMHGHSFHTSGTFTETLRDRKTGAVQQIHGEYRFNLSSFYDGHWAFTRMQWVMKQ